MADFPSSRSSSDNDCDDHRPQQQSQQTSIPTSKAMMTTTTTTTTTTKIQIPIYDLTLASARRPRGFEGFDVLQKIVSSSANSTEHPLHFFSDEKVVVIYDAYPKASFHLLMLPRDISIKRVADFDWSRENHKNLLLHMKRVSNEIVSSIRQSNVSSSVPSFRVGFHSKPSLLHCHMHIISTDFYKSPNMKHKTHYQSFSTEFLIELDEVLGILSKEGNNNRIPTNELARRIASGEDSQMVCYYCKKFQTDGFAKLKKHFEACPQLN